MNWPCWPSYYTKTSWSPNHCHHLDQLTDLGVVPTCISSAVLRVTPAVSPCKIKSASQNQQTYIQLVKTMSVLHSRVTFWRLWSDRSDSFTCFDGGWNWFFRLVFEHFAMWNLPETNVLDLEFDCNWIRRWLQICWRHPKQIVSRNLSVSWLYRPFMLRHLLAEKQLRGSKRLPKYAFSASKEKSHYNLKNVKVWRPWGRIFSPICPT